jgi:hypothetical protein
MEDGYGFFGKNK